MFQLSVTNRCEPPQEEYLDAGQPRRRDISRNSLRPRQVDGAEHALYGSIGGEPHQQGNDCVGCRAIVTRCWDRPKQERKGPKEQDRTGDRQAEVGR